MSDARYAILENRAVLRARGPDARPLLQRLVTGNLDQVTATRAVYSLLLTPQGKFLFDFFMVADPADESAVLIDCAAARAGELAKRLTMYKLRADAAMEDASGDYAVAAIWGEVPAPVNLDGKARGEGSAFAGGTAYIDPRLPDLGARALVPVKNVREAFNRLSIEEADAEAYRTFHVSLGVPDGAEDIRAEDDFPIECNLDLLHGIDFKKGCFVGQEVASRTHRKAKVRKRIAAADLDGAAPEAGTDVTIGDAKVGSIAGTAGDQALALVFLDRVAKAGSTDAKAGEAALHLRVPAYGDYSLDAAETEA